MDKRIQRTQRQLQAALIDLMVEKGYDNVTVQHILDRASVGRATFYSHFRDKEALLKSSVQNLRRGLLQRWEQQELKEPFGFVILLLKHIESSRPIYQSLMSGEGGTIVDRQFRKILAEFMRKDLAAPEPEREATTQFLMGGLMSLVTWWMDYQVPLTAEQVNGKFLELARGCAA